VLMIALYMYMWCVDDCAPPFFFFFFVA
jgi:hypothetical protein